MRDLDGSWRSPKGGRHEEWTCFRDTLNQMGSQEVYIEFAQTARHGFAIYQFDLDRTLLLHSPLITTAPSARWRVVLINLASPL